jgi:phosphatidylglycerophosphate synthase
MASKPWDSRLAHRLVLPLRATSVHPNHVTTLALATGLAASACYARATPVSANLGAALWVVACVLDHADGELARLTGKTSVFGHRYDRAADLVVKLSLFAGMGASLRHGPLQHWGIPLGLLGGSALLAIFLLRGAMARRRGAAAYAQPSAGGFEIEDILYVIAPLTWLGWLGPFLVLAAIGTPLFALWTVRQFLRWRAAGGAGEGAEGLDRSVAARLTAGRGMGQEAAGRSPDAGGTRA